MELFFQNPIDAASFLFGTQLPVEVRFSPTAKLSTFSMLTGSIAPAIKRALRCKTALALQKQFFTFAPAQFAYRPTILCHMILSYSFLKI
jgi:hypothetical protein